MPVFTSIGTAIAGSAAIAAGTSAFGVGVGASALALGTAAGAVALTGGFDGDKGVLDTRVGMTGALSAAEAQTIAKKRAFRSGVLFTSPTGLDGPGRTSSAKLR